MKVLIEDNLEIVEGIRGFYSFGGIRKFLALNGYSSENAYIAILKDIVRKYSEVRRSRSV